MRKFRPLFQQVANERTLPPNFKWPVKKTMDRKMATIKWSPNIAVPVELNLGQYNMTNKFMLVFHYNPIALTDVLTQLRSCLRYEPDINMAYIDGKRVTMEWLIDYTDIMLDINVQDAGEFIPNMTYSWFADSCKIKLSDIIMRYLPHFVQK